MAFFIKARWLVSDQPSLKLWLLRIAKMSLNTPPHAQGGLTLCVNTREADLNEIGKRLGWLGFEHEIPSSYIILVIISTLLKLKVLEVWLRHI